VIDGSCRREHIADCSAGLGRPILEEIGDDLDAAERENDLPSAHQKTSAVRRPIHA